MILTRRADYGLRAMLDIASLPTGSRAVIPDIAERQDIPQVFLAKIVPRLAKAGLLRTYRGVSGGVTLGQPASQISMRQIIEAIEGPLALNRCSVEPDGCARHEICPMVDIWCDAQADLNRRLDGTLLSDLVARMQGIPVVQATN